MITKRMNLFRLSKTFRPCSTARMIVAKLSSERIIRLAFLATWVPEPIAMPMSAALIAGASFTPSPVIATTSPFFLSVSTSSTLCSGATRPTTPMSSIRASRSSSLQRGEVGAQHRRAGDAELLGDGRAGVTSSPVTMRTRMCGVLGVAARLPWTRRGAGRPWRPGDVISRSVT